MNLGRTKERHSMINTFLKTAALIAGLFSLFLPMCAQIKQDSTSKQRGAGISPISYTIHQEVDFNANPKNLYGVLLSSKQFSEMTTRLGGFTATSANIDPTIGGAFSVFDGHIIGRFLELVPNQRIVEAWRVVTWPDGVYSIAKFELRPQGTGTHLVFDHTGFPEELREHLAEGWQQHYFEPLAKYVH